MIPYIFPAIVLRWVDGDTVEVGLQLLPHPPLTLPGARIRLLRVDTPERGEPLYIEAGVRSAQLAPMGSPVFVRVEKMDSFGRYLSDVYTPDGVCIADQLLAEGLGVPYTRK